MDFKLSTSKETEDHIKLVDWLEVYYVPVDSRFGKLHPSDSDLLHWVVGIHKGAEIVAGLPLFKNNHKLSLQVPMHQTYYTNNVALEMLNSVMTNVKVVYTSEFNVIKELQEIIINQLKEE